VIGNAALAIWMDVDPAGEEDFNAWYSRQHLPERLGVPGFLRGRRYAAVGSAPAYFTLYETATADVLSSPAYLERLNDPTDWTRRALPVVRRMTRNAYRRLAATPGDGVERHLLTARVQPASGRGPYVRDWLEAEVAGTLAGLEGVAAAAVYATETGGTSVVTEERRIVGGEVVGATPFLALLEVADPSAEAPLRVFWAAWATRIAADVTVDFYRLLYGLAWI
jgi:hypothetical protein